MNWSIPTWINTACLFTTPPRWQESPAPAHPSGSHSSATSPGYFCVSWLDLRQMKKCFRVVWMWPSLWHIPQAGGKGAAHSNSVVRRALGSTPRRLDFAPIFYGYKRVSVGFGKGQELLSAQRHVHLRAGTYSRFRACICCPAMRVLIWCSWLNTSSNSQACARAFLNPELETCSVGGSRKEASAQGHAHHFSGVDLTLNSPLLLFLQTCSSSPRLSW